MTVWYDDQKPGKDGWYVVKYDDEITRARQFVDGKWRFELTLLNYNPILDWTDVEQFDKPGDYYVIPIEEDTVISDMRLRFTEGGEELGEIEVDGAKFMQFAHAGTFSVAKDVDITMQGHHTLGVVDRFLDQLRGRVARAKAEIRIMGSTPSIPATPIVIKKEWPPRLYSAWYPSEDQAQKAADDLNEARAWAEGGY